MKKNTWIIIGAIFVVIIAALIALNQEDQKQTVVSAILPGIEEFVRSNSNYGTIKEFKNMPDWANGKRQQINTTTGNYLFYLYGNEVVGVWEYKSNGEREQIFHKDIPSEQKNVNREAASGLPAYTIIDQVNLLSGGRYGDILITTYSKSTSKKLIEKVLRQIASKEGFTQAALYCTMDAYKANNSASFSKEHPNALNKGFLGMLNEDGTFYSE
ncbi:MAG: hypothetical protein STSR0008_20390 [Ignavibacterium sp.]